MNSTTTATIVKFFANNKEWSIGVVSAIIGAVLTLITTIVWDNHKNQAKYKSLLKLLLYELKENKKRVDSVIERLPQNILDCISKESTNINEGVFVPNEYVSNMGWSFPKSYTIDAWKTFISSGFATELPSELFLKIYKIYDSIESINFLNNLSVNLFQILSQQNRLDDQTNKNFDQFCKFGTKSLEVMLSKGSINETVADLEKIIK